MFSFTSVNWIAVIVGTVVSMALGTLWYSPLFGKTWLRLIGKSPEEIESDPTMYIKTAVAGFCGDAVLKSCCNQRWFG